MAATTQETGEITRCVELYVEGARDGDTAKLRRAFHPDARMWGCMGGQRYDEPISEMIGLLAGQPADPDGSYRAEVTAVEQTGDIATAKLVEDCFWGTVSFVDLFTLARIHGEWKIVDKAFTHTSGEPPAQ